MQLLSCKTDKNQVVKQQDSTIANLKTVTVAIQGMTCEIGCAKTIESKISKMEGVSASKVNFDERKGIFTYNSNIATQSDIIKEINELLDGETYLATVVSSSSKK